ncbi:hypothetical protein CsSME_00037925 [Camellia sinensis var. sinensis]
MLGKKIGSVKKLAKKVKVTSAVERETSQYECLLRECDEESLPSATATVTATTPTGFLAIYVGEGDERQRFVVPTGYLSHPLFKMLLEKSSNEYGFEQRNGLLVPCTVTAFQEVLSAIEYGQSKFDFGELVQEFI